MVPSATLPCLADSSGIAGALLSDYMNMNTNTQSQPYPWNVKIALIHNNSKEREIESEQFQLSAISSQIIFCYVLKS